MTSHVKNYGLQRIPCEHIEVVCQGFCFALKCLDNARCLTADVVLSLFGVFRISFVEDFKDLFGL